MTTNTRQNIIAINKETGEIIADITLGEHQELGVITRATKEQREFLNNNKEHKSFTSSLNGFVTVLYYNNQALFDEKRNPHEKISKANVTRLMMLATYVNYENYLIFDPTYNTIEEQLGGVQYMTKKDIQQILNLKDTTFKQFFKETTSAKILQEDNGKFFLHKGYFYKGSIKEHKNSLECNYTRIYIDTVRQVYNGSTNKQHGVLTYVFQLIPCIHYSTNYLCKDVASSHKEISYMNIQDISEFLGLSTNKGSMSRLKKDLMSIHIEYRGEKFYLFNEIEQSNATIRVQRFLVNPLLVTSMSNMDNIKKTIKKLFIG